MKAITMTLAAVSALIAVPAAAQPSALTDSFEVPVAYLDLDLSTAAGQKAIKRRISTAGRNACGERELTFMSDWAKVNACESEFRRGAEQQVQNAVRSGAR